MVLNTRRLPRVLHSCATETLTERRAGLESNYFTSSFYTGTVYRCSKRENPGRVTNVYIYFIAKYQAANNITPYTL